MPALTFLAVAGLALIALLFVANATLEPPGSPVIVTSQRSGLPESRRPGAIQTLTNCASTRARYDIASCACRATQVGA